MRVARFGMAIVACMACALPGATQERIQIEPTGGGKRLEQAKSGTLDISGMRSGVSTARKAVVRDARAFAALWKEHAGAGTSSPPPAVDFSKNDVIAVFLGAKPTGGFSVKIDDVKTSRTGAVANITATSPGPGSIVTQAFTQPFAMRAVPKLPANVKFNIREVQR